MQQGQQISVKSGMDLQAVAAVLFYVGIDKVGNDAFTGERFTHLLRQLRSGLCRRGLSFGLTAIADST